MKKVFLLLLSIFILVLMESGCGKPETSKDDPWIFDENIFKGAVIDDLKKSASLEVEGRYVIGYLYSESFSFEESGTYDAGNLKLKGSYFHPIDFGLDDVDLSGGRKYERDIVQGGNLDFLLNDGSIAIADFYQKYLDPQYRDPGTYTYEEIDAESGGLILEENKSFVTTSGDGRQIYVYSFSIYRFEASKADGKVRSGFIRNIEIKSYSEINDEIGKLYEGGFGDLFTIADSINQNKGLGYSKGVYSIEEFQAEFK